jgi:hypothetical protein
VTEVEIIEYVSGLPGVVTVTASEENAAPAAAWGDTFFFYDPDGTGESATPVRHCGHP